MGTTAEKLTYLNTTKGKIKDSINLTGAGITTEPFRQYAVKLKDAYVDIINNGTETLYNNFPKVSATGESMELSNTYEAPMQSTLKGNTSQVQLSGKNLLDDTQWVQNRVINNTSGDITYSQNNASSEQYMAVQPNTTYTFSSALSCRALRVGTYKSDKTFIERKSSSANVSTWTFTTDANTYYLRWNINYNDTTITQDNIDALQLQINSGNERGTYEQYCGGTPSPNPSYPQDIHNVSGNNSIVVCGKNLFDKSAMVMNSAIDAGNGNMTSSDNFRTAYIKCKPNTTYSISKILSNRFVVGFTSDEDLTLPKTLTNVWSNQAITTKTITSPNNAYYMFITLSKITDDTTPIQDILDSLQVEINETPTTYEAYNGTTYPINLPSGMELSKIGTYQDYFYKENDKWYLHKEIGKVVLNGSESWILNNNYTNNSRFTDNDDILNKTIRNVYCNYFVKGTAGQDNTNIDINGSTGKIMLTIPNSIATTVSTLITWLSTNNVIVNYILATPTNTEITDTTLISQLEAIYNAKSKNGTTNINQENNDLPFIITASALEKEV